MICPFCNEEIKDWAKKCRYCWEFLDWRNQNKEDKAQSVASWNIYYDMAPTIHCPTCWYTWKPWKVLKGNFFIGFLLYRFMLIPWIIYSIRRRSKTTCCCPKCWNKIVEIIQSNKEESEWVTWEAKKKKMWVWWRCLTIFGILIFIWIIAWNSAEKRVENNINNNETTATETDNHQYIPWLTNADIQINLEKKWFTCDKSLKDWFRTRCKIKQSDADHDVEIYWKTATKIYLVDAMTINYTNTLNKDFLWYIASLPYDTAEPENAKNRVIENIWKNNSTEIWWVKYEIESNNWVVRLYIWDKNEY